MLLGGEPFLHPNLIELCQIARNIFPEIEIKILTNGIILNNYDTKKLKKLEELNIHISISKYPNQDYKDFSNNKNISYLNDRFFFDQTLVDPLGKQDNKTRIYSCPNRIPCFTLKDFKIYFCQFGAHINNFCNYFFKQIPLIENKDFIKLTEKTNLQDLQNLKLCEKNICKYCRPGDVVDWDQSTKTYDEYTKTEKELFLTNYNEYYKKFVDFSNFQDFSKKKSWNNVDSWYVPDRMRTFRKRNEGKIDIIIPFYTVNKIYFQKCLDSVFKQSIINDCVIYLISDNSPDKRYVYEFYKTYNKIYNIILLDTQKTKSGPASARTLGINNSFNKYFFCLDSDDYFYDNEALENLYIYAENNNYGIVNGQTYDKNEFIHDAHSYLYNREFFIKNNFSYGKFIYNEDRFLSLQIFNFYNGVIPFLEQPIYVYNRNNESMGKDINFLYMTINELIVFTYFYRRYLTNKKYEDNHFIFEHIFNKIIVNLSIIEKITDKDKEYLKDIKQEEAICLSLICLILIDDKILFNKLPLFYKDLLNKIKKEDFIKLNNTVLFNLNSLFNKGNYILDNNKLIKQFINKEYIDFIKYEEEKYGNQFKLQNKLE